MKKRFLLLGLIMTLLIGSTIGLYPAAVVAADDYEFSAGNGTSGNPYVVMTAEDLDHVRDHLGASYILGADIDLSGYATGEGWEPIGEDGSSPFTGTFDGNNYLIKNLFIDRNIQYIGLFGYAQNATLQNIRLLDVDIDASATFLGALVGMASSTVVIGSSVSSVSASGVNNSSIDSHTGGLVGYVVDSGAAIKNSYAAIDVSSTRVAGGLVGMVEQSANVVESSFATGNVTATAINYYAGGLASDFRATLRNSYATGNVVGNRQVGGLIGNTVLGGDTLNSSFQTGTVTGALEVGKVLGSYFGSNMAADLFYNSSVNVTLPEIGTASGVITGIQGLSDEDMRIRAAYGNALDFDSVWGINEGISYPYLRVFTPIVRVNDPSQYSYKQDSQLVLDGFVMDGSIGEAIEVSYTITNSTNTTVASGSEVLVSATEDIQSYSLSETLDGARFPEGMYTVHMIAEDLEGHQAPEQTTTFIVDHTAPVITLLGANPLQLDEGTAFTDPGATALDEVDGDVTSDITVSGSVDSSTVGSYTLIYSVTDAAGNEGTATRIVNVLDTAAPVITLLGANPLQHEAGTVFIDPSATALDAGDGDVTADLTVSGSVESSTVGSYTLTYSVTDSAGNEGTMTRTVNVVDTAAPVITLLGANPLQHEAGTTYTEPGATALDAVDGDLTSEITVSGSVDSSTVGSYTLTYSVTDEAGNEGTATRIVNVVDTAAPVITLNGSSPLQHEVGTTYIDAGATALDEVDGDVTSDVTVSGSVDSSTVGSYTLIYSVTDSAGNEGTMTRTVNVVDTAAPVITLLGANPLQHEAGTVFIDPGATALDAGDGDVTTDLTVSGSVESSTVGSYTLTYSVTDAAGNEGTATRIVNVVDTAAPVITLLGANPLQHEAGTVFIDPGATALDAGDGDVTADLTVNGSVESSTVGSYTLTYSVTDSAGNEGTMTRTVNVVDTVAPVITLNGDNPYFMNVGSLFSDPGATALDAGDGDLTASITINGEVEINKAGNYTLTYEVADRSGNVATATRLIRITRAYDVTSGDSRLAQLTVLVDDKPEQLAPAFNSEITEYRLETTGEMLELALKSSDANAIVMVGQQFVDGKITLPIVEGIQTITVTVNAENGSQRHYYLIVTRVAVQDNINPVEEACQFADIQGHWAEKAICEAASLKIVEGISKTIFAPNQSVTRTEFAVMLLRTLQIPTEQQVNTDFFSDGASIPQWAQAAIMTGVDRGVLHGYPDGTFRPVQVINRVEMAAMLAKALNWDEKLAIDLPFIDAANIPAWSLAFVEAVYSNGLLQGRSDNQFVPNGVTTRAEAAVVMLRLWQLLQQI